MADLISLTGTAIRVGNTPISQSLDTVLDVGGYDELTLEFMVVSFESPSTPSLTVQLQTAMQREIASDNSWVILGAIAFNATASAVPKAATFANGQFLRYIRWNSLGGTGFSAATFWIEGVGRRYSKT